MNIQIWGKSKSFDSKKAERWFKERRIKYQYIDLLRYGISKGELTSVKNAVGLDALVDPRTWTMRCSGTLRMKTISLICCWTRRKCS